MGIPVLDIFFLKVIHYNKRVNRLAKCKHEKIKKLKKRENNEKY